MTFGHASASTQMLAAATVKISSSFHQYTGLWFGALLGSLQHLVLDTGEAGGASRDPTFGISGWPSLGCVSCFTSSAVLPGGAL